MIRNIEFSDEKDMKSQDGIPIIIGKDNMISLGMDKKELQAFLEESNILEKHRPISNGYDWYDLWICPASESFLSSLCFNPFGKLETITLYPFIRPTSIPQTWDTLTEERLVTDREICEKWLKDNCDLKILNRATVFIDKRGWNTGILIR